MYGGKIEPIKRSVQEIYARIHPGSYTEAQHKKFFEGRMTNIRRYGLAYTVPSPTNHRTVEFIELSPFGVQSLKAHWAASPQQPDVPADKNKHNRYQLPAGEVTVDGIFQLIDLYQKLHPEKVVDYSINVRSKEAASPSK
jgi:hypothetical protein